MRQEMTMVRPISQGEIDRDVRLKSGTLVTTRARLVSNPTVLNQRIGPSWTGATVDGTVIDARAVLVKGRRTKKVKVNWTVGQSMIEKEMNLGNLKLKEPPLSDEIFGDNEADQSVMNAVPNEENTVNDQDLESIPNNNQNSMLVTHGLVWREEMIAFPLNGPVLARSWSVKPLSGPNITEGTAPASMTPLGIFLLHVFFRTFRRNCSINQCKSPGLAHYCWRNYQILRGDHTDDSFQVLR